MSLVSHLCSFGSAMHSSRDAGAIFCVVQDASLFEDIEGVPDMMRSF